MPKKDSKANKNLVSKCGLYCGSCKKYHKGKCVGCKDHEKADWCKPRTCCIENKIDTCASCRKYDDPTECKMAFGILPRFFSVFFNSDRKANLDYIKKNGVKKYSIKMAEAGEPTIKRR